MKTLVIFIRLGRRYLFLFCNLFFTKQRLPETASYRQEVEQWYSFIAKVTTEKTEVSPLSTNVFAIPVIDCSSR